MKILNNTNVKDDNCRTKRKKNFGITYKSIQKRMLFFCVANNKNANETTVKEQKKDFLFFYIENKIGASCLATG